MRYLNPEKFSCLALAIIFVWVFVGGCVSGPRPIESILDSPNHHVLNGFKLLRKNRVNDAMREFKLALEYDLKQSSALRGLGLVYGMKKHFKPAFEYMSRAMDFAKKKEDKALAYVGFMRLHIMKKDKGWLGKVEGYFRLTISMIEDFPEGYYYMGLAYKYGYEFANAKKSFQRILEMDTSFMPEAREQINRLNKIEQAMPRSELGKRMIVMDRITRAEIAALFIEELELDRIYNRVPSKKKKGTFQQMTIPADVLDHPLRREIETVLQMGIQGLRIFPDGMFGPDEFVTRASYATMIADIIATVENDPSILKKYKGRRSPFEDVRSDANYFSAIMTCTSRDGIMTAENGLFKPMLKVSGAEALLVIKKLKEELGIDYTTPTGTVGN